MPDSAAIPNLGHDFDDFLFAPVGEDRNGMPLSVLSALARLDLDPWQEAAKLAQLPVAAATARLAGLIGTLPEGTLPRPDCKKIAARLVALLPRGATAASRQRKGAPTLVTAILSRAGGAPKVNPLAIIYVVFIIAVLGTLGIMANQQPTATDEQAPATSQPATSQPATSQPATSQPVAPAPPPNNLGR